MPWTGSSTRHRRALWLFAALGFYILLQSAWWAWLLVSKDREMEQLIAAFDLRPEAVGLDPVHASRTLWMVAGEGLVLVALQLVALAFVFRTVREELRLAARQHDLMLAVSHELRTPVAGMKLHLQTLARQGLTPAEQSDLQQRALTDVQRLHELTERVLLTAQLEEGVVHLDPAPHDLLKLTEEVVHRAKGSFAAGRIIRVHGKPASARVDRAAYISVLQNLLENATKYSAPSTDIEVELREEHGWCVVRVLDRGIGIPATERRRIFEKFHRGRVAVDQQVKGTGLGLYIADRLVHRMGGMIGVTGRPEGGSIFAASFPKA